MLSINMFFDKGFHWIIGKNIAVRGYAYIGDDYYDTTRLLEYIVREQIFQPETLKNLVSNISGSFAIVYDDNDISILCVDILRTFPLFYAIIDGKIMISNSSKDLAKYTNYQIDEEALKDFEQAGYVNVDRTIYHDVFQVEGGSIVVWQQGLLKKIEYFSYVTNSYDRRSVNQLSYQLQQIFDSVAARLVKSLDGRTAVIPLSGGYDSRLIATLLKKMDFANVICFSYGRKDSFEASLSKKVAEKLGYRWIFVEYDDDLLLRTLSSDDFQKYLEFGFNGVSVSHVQDFFAVKKMCESNSIPDNSVFLPGHSGDLFAGTHVIGTRKAFLTKQQIDKIISNHHFILSKGKNELHAVVDGQKASRYFAHSVMEDWDIKNRQSKFIVNSNRVYEFFGYQHRIPLWDSQLTSFFRRIDVVYKNRNEFSYYKESENLYDFTIMKVFSYYGIDFRKSDSNLKDNAARLFRYIIKKVARNRNTIDLIKGLANLGSKDKKPTGQDDPDNFAAMARLLGYNIKSYTNLNSIVVNEIEKTL